MVVHEHQIASTKTEGSLMGRIVHPGGQPPATGVPGIKVGTVGRYREVELGIEAELTEPAGRVELDHRASVDRHVGAHVVAEVDLDGGERLVEGGLFAAHRLGGRKTIDEH